MALTIGLSVTSGFVFMLILDEVVSWCAHKQKEKNEKMLEEREGLISGHTKSRELASQVEGASTTVAVTTAGLCFHSMAEGVAMGASQYLGAISQGAKSALGATVVIALFIHKIPESIAFGSYLVHQMATKK